VDALVRGPRPLPVRPSKPASDSPKRLSVLPAGLNPHHGFREQTRRQPAFGLAVARGKLCELVHDFGFDVER